MSQRFAPRGGPRQDVAAATLLPILDRLRVTVEAENREISVRSKVDYRGHTQRKNQGLFELTRMKPQIELAAHRPDVAAAIADLAAKLEVNRRLLDGQLRAARTVADIVTRAIRDSQSDGTYSAYPWRDV